MADTTIRATPEKIEQARQLLAMANLPAENRIELDGFIALGLEPQISDLIANLQKLISEKEAAYNEYKNSVKKALKS